MGDLLAVGQERIQQAWEHTAHVKWVIAETSRNPAKRAQPFTPDDFNPYSAKAAKAAPKKFQVSPDEWVAWIAAAIGATKR